MFPAISRVTAPWETYRVPFRLPSPPRCQERAARAATSGAPGPSGSGELLVVQPPVLAPARDQSGMRPLLDDAAGGKDDDAIRALHRREAMRDHEHGAPRHEALERALHPCLGRVSSADVASSRISIGASLRKARAIASRWRSPPEKRAPRSPTTVS